MRTSVRWLVAPALALALGAAPAVAQDATPETAAQAAPTVEEARAFVADAEARLRELWMHAGYAEWVQANFITEDTQILAAKAREDAIAATMRFAKGAARFDGLDLAAEPELARKLRLLKVALTLPAPSDPALTAELTKITSEMEAIYGAGEYCPEGEGGECLDLIELSNIIADSRDPEELARAWAGWRTVSPKMRPLYERYVELANAGARELGFADLGALWRSKYDMAPDAFAAELERLWGQVKPLYEALHCYVRAELNEQYGDAVVPLDAPIRADLLGNMWAQEWGNIYEVVAPDDMPESAIDITALLEAKGVDHLEMVRYGERFFSSLGFAPLPETFWERSLFTKPADREVVCHASAWSLDYENDLRIKMCIQVNEEDFVTIHHELGHNYYQRAYNELPFLYQDSANDGFHEAVGDTLALSVTPEYLVEIGLLDAAPSAENDVGMLLKSAMDKIAFLPFGLLIDQWRWRVFSGEFGPEEYNETWWDLREKYQGIRPPVARSEADFDPGAKYHIPANVPYTRYFLARILQFQFHEALCEIAGDEGPLHRCSIYGSAEAGKALADMLEMGASRPWPDALEALTGSREMDASAIVDYYRPLLGWLEEQNAKRSCGW